MKKKKRFWTIVFKALTVLLGIVLIVLIGFLLVLAQPKPEDTEKPEPQPLLAASPARSITEESEIRGLIEEFPVPVLSFMGGSGMLFVSGSSADVGLEDGFGRIVTLNWQTADGDPMILQSIYPASALPVLDNGFHFSQVTGPTLFGVESVRMEKGDVVRIHAATDTGLYVVTVPKSAAPKLSNLCRSLQLFTVKKEE